MRLELKKRRAAALIGVLLILLGLTGLTGCKKAPVEYETDLIQNGQFAAGDNGLPQQWRYVAYDNNPAVSLAQAQDGAAHLVHYAANDSRFVQTIPVSPQTIYRIQAQICAKNVAGLDYGAGISIENTFIASPQVYDTDGQWQTVTLYVNSGDQTALGVELRLGFFSNDALGEAWFKNVTACAVQSAPEGATVWSYQSIDQASGNSGEQTASDHAGAMLLFFALLMLVAAPLCGRVFARDRKLGDEIEPGAPAVDRVVVALVALTALCLRLLLAVAVTGYQVDIGCFTAWSEHVYTVGPSQFYQTVSFCDYPPGYLYVLWIVAFLRRLLGVTTGSAAYGVLLKLPAILCDVAAGYVILRALRGKTGERLAFFAACAYWFNPAALVDGACWGQIDAVLVLGLLLMLVFLREKKLLKASVAFAVAVLIKPQALMAGPLLLFGFIQAICEDRRRGLMELGADFVICAALCVAAVLPFWGTQEPLWIVEKYASTLSSYPYAAVNAMNLFGLFGANWVEQTASFLPGVSYQLFGTVMMALSVIYAFFLFFKRRDERILPLLGAVILCGVFVLGVRMHERYLFPALMMLLLAWGYTQDIRLMRLYVLFTASQFLNISLVLCYEYLLEGQRVATIVFSAVNLFALASLFWVAWDLCVRGHTVLAPERPERPERQADAGLLKRLAPDPERGKITRFDVWAVCVVTVVYALFALVRLGDTHAPISSYTSTAPQEAVVYQWDRPEEISRFYYYGGIGSGRFTLEASLDGETWTAVSVSVDGETTYQDGSIEYALNTMFEWHEVLLAPTTATQMRLTFSAAGIPLIEIGFKDPGGQVVTPDAVWSQGARVSDYDPHALIDEQQEIPERPTYLNSMYFDEIYHARTAYEHLNGMEWYETTHPPLGKALMSLCIALLGMTPFAWRLAGTLAGVLMLPGMYLTAKLLFKNSKIALLAMLLMTFDCMHYTQTRIATIDSFAVLFIIWMFYFMMRYVLLHDFNREPLRKTFPTLLLSGVMMGLGIASKWIGIYAGAGLAVTFFYCLVLRWQEYRLLAVPDDQGIIDMRPYWKKVLGTGAFCVLVFVLIPALIYLASYAQYFSIRGGKTLADWWRAQVYMFNYHSGLTEPHFFQSPWYEWPLIIRPMWYYKGNHDGLIVTINAMGNPAVWWAGLAAMVWLIGRKCAGKARDIPSTLLIIGVAAQFLPWTLVPRSTFIYHYFASVPFIIWAICYFVQSKAWEADEWGRKRLKWGCVAYLAVVVLLFAFFFPAISGLDMPVWYAKLLKWMPTWTMWSY